MEFSPFVIEPHGAFGNLRKRFVSLLELLLKSSTVAGLVVKLLPRALQQPPLLCTEAMPGLSAPAIGRPPNLSQVLDLDAHVALRIALPAKLGVVQAALSAGQCLSERSVPL